MKKNLIAFSVCFVLVILCAFMSFSNISNAEAQVDSNKGRIASLQNQLDVAKSTQVKNEQQLVLSETGYDADRVELDVSAAEAFMQKLFDWSTNAEYVSIRNSLMKDYNLKEDSNFMCVFMPEPYVNTSKDGTEYPYIDLMELNANYRDMDIQVRNIADGTYSYFARVSWYVTAKDGAAEYTESMFLFDTNDDHELLNLEAYNLQ